MSKPDKKKDKNKLPKKMFRLHAPSGDTVTGVVGSLTHMQVYPGGVIHYIFQPRGLNPKTGAPVARYWLTSDRVSPDTEKVPMPQLPVQAFGVDHEDMVTGFKGKVISFTIHPEGCVHATLQSMGVKEDGSKQDSEDMDLRRLNGPVIQPMEDDAYFKSMRVSPSPAGDLTCGFEGDCMPGITLPVLAHSVTR
jgi:hypothetical protein